MSFILAGLIATARRPSSRAGLLITAVGFAWLATYVKYVEGSLPFTVGELLTGFQWLVLAHLLTIFPAGRPQTRMERFTIAFIYAFAVVNAIGTLPFDAARDCHGCPTNLLSIHPDTGLSDAMSTVIAVGSVAVVL